MMRSRRADLYNSKISYISALSALIHCAELPLLRRSYLLKYGICPHVQSTTVIQNTLVGLQLSRMTGRLGLGSGRYWQRLCLG